MDRFRFSSKGHLEVGADADFALVDLGSSFPPGANHLFYRHKTSLCVGKTFRGKIMRTVLRVTTVFRDGQIVSEPVGRFINPGRRAPAALSVGAEQVGQPPRTS